jgi:hypothetical protein
MRPSCEFDTARRTPEWGIGASERWERALNEAARGCEAVLS